MYSRRTAGGCGQGDQIGRIFNDCEFLQKITEVALVRVVRFFSVQYTKTGKNIPNYRKMYQMAINAPFGRKLDKNANIFNCTTFQKFTQIWIFGSIIYHLATLAQIFGLLFSPDKLKY
jgi:hypothetical protein